MPGSMISLPPPFFLSWFPSIIWYFLVFYEICISIMISFTDSPPGQWWGAHRLVRAHTRLQKRHHSYRILRCAYCDLPTAKPTLQDTDFNKARCEFVIFFVFREEELGLFLSKIVCAAWLESDWSLLTVEVLSTLP